VALGISVAVLAGFAPQAAANTYKVNTRSDHNPGNCNAADCTLREAVIKANAHDGNDTIRLPAADRPYRLTRSGEDDDALKGDLDLVDDALDIKGKGAKRTIVKQTAADRVVELQATTPPTDVALKGLTITGGDAGDQSGGGILTLGEIFLTKVTVKGNRARVGGGIAALTSPARLSLSESTITDNRAETIGGGLDVAATDQAANVITASTIAGNRAPQGGGVYFRPGDAELRVLTSTITGNLSLLPDPPMLTSNGGGLFVENLSAGPGTVKVAQTTIAANEAPPGRGANIHAEVLTQLENTLIGADLGGGASCDLAIDSSGHNLDQGTSCGLDQGTDVEDADGALKPLDDNGGPTKTMALKGASDALGEGTCPGTLLQRGVDQRGVGRPPTCDIGAFERDPLP
jgi:CSLREA domain-containing protein